MIAPDGFRITATSDDSAAAAVSKGGPVLIPDVTVVAHRDLIIALAARYRLPAVYAFRYFAMAGGLMSYGIDILEQNRQAASYVDRILRGANPADLPVQAPTKYETVLNLKTAKAPGFDVPPTGTCLNESALDRPKLAGAGRTGSARRLRVRPCFGTG